MAHTPGPWIVEGPTGDHKAIIISQIGDGWHRLAVEVDSDDCDYDTAEANARLIAAAPALLAACERFLDAWGRPLGPSRKSFDAALVSQAIPIIRAAVALARGEVKP